MIRGPWFLRTAIVTWSILIPSQQLPAADSEVGYVFGIDPAGSHCATLSLNGTRRTALPGASLHRGVRIDLVGKTCVVSLMLRETLSRVTFNQSPYTIQSSIQLPESTVSALKTLDKLISILKPYDPQNSPANGSRGGPLEVRIAGGSEQTVQSGTRSLALRWSGGTGPFAIVVQATFTGETFCLETTKTNFVVCPVKPYMAGSYTITIRDSRGNERELKVEAVTGGRTECIETAKALPSLSDARLAATAKSVRIAACGPEWRFEAYQVLAGLWADYQPAEVIVEGLEGGYNVASDRQ
jgi:hypothetical protein